MNKPFQYSRRVGCGLLVALACLAGSASPAATPDEGASILLPGINLATAAEEAAAEEKTQPVDREIEDAVDALLLPTPEAEAPRPRSAMTVENDDVGFLDRGPAELFDVSARASDGMQVDELELDEMPYEASSGDWFSSGRRYGSADFLMFNMSRNHRRLLGYDIAYVPDPKPARFNGAFTTASIPFDLAPAARFTVGEYLDRDYLDRDRALEYTYYGGMSFFQKDGWNSLSGKPLITPLARDLPGFAGAQSYFTTLNSVFNSMEINYKLHRRLGRDQMVMSPNGGWTKHAERGFLPTLILGTRVANVNEIFSFYSRIADVPVTTFGGDYDIQTQNWLWGVTFGAELISQNEFYYWGLRGKVTPSMAYDANQQSTVSVNNIEGSLYPTGSVNRTSANSQFAPGAVSDLTLMLGWNVTPNFTVKAGYDMLWVAGISTATRQLNLDNRRINPIDAGGQIFYSGFSFGCEGSW